MAEMSKGLKILLGINIIVALIYGIMYLFFPEIIYAINEAPYFDPHFWRLWGGVCMTLGIVAIFGLVKGDWIYFKLLFFFAICFLFVTFIINITTALYLPRSPVNLMYHWIDNIIIILIAIIDIIFYSREEKR